MTIAPELVDKFGSAELLRVATAALACDDGTRARFDEWYPDTPGHNRVLTKTLGIDHQPDGSCLYNSQAGAPDLGGARGPRRAG